MKKQNPQTVSEWIALVEQGFSEYPLYFGHGTDNPEDEAAWLVSHVVLQDTQLSEDEITPETLVKPEHAEQIMTLLSQRTQQKTPLAYLLNEAWFAGHRFYVDERVLVPRSPIAELVSNQFAPLLKETPRRILDLCCGSGCIGIAAALAFPESQVVLSDNSAQALEVAAINIRQFALSDRVSLCESDLFADLEGRFDLIISNPPYVSQEEYQDLPEEYHREPEAGLVSNQGGLEIPLSIIGQASDYLNSTGLLVLETGYTWPELEKATTELSKIWLDFEFGGEGVCAIAASDLV